MSASIIKVDRNGLGPDGDSYDHLANPDLVRAGYMVNRPVLIQYPDGRLKEGNEIRLTAKGIEHLRRNLPVEDRAPAGNG